MCSVVIYSDISDDLALPWTPKTPLTIPDPRKRFWTLICITFWTLLFMNMAGSVRSCCVCGKTRADNTVLHSFPDPTKEADRFLLWVHAIGGSLSTLDHEFIFKNRKICHDHFEEKFLTWSRRLAHGAFPTVRIPGMQGRSVMGDITNIATPLLSVPVASTSTSDVAEDLSNNDIAETNVTHPVASTSYDVTPAKNCDLSSILKGSTVKSSRQRPKGPIFMDDKTALLETIKILNKKKDSYATRLKKALRLSENTTFQNMLKKFTATAAIFFAMQFREITKKKLGRRFTEQEKIMALSIYKQGPRCYRMLRRIFLLPSSLTLSRLIARANIRAGINDKLFKVLQNKIKKFTTDDRLCILIFDEIALTPHFEYNQRKDDISGFATKSSNKIADHALVFMLRGVTRNYKQPVAYTFCSGSTKKEELGELITDIIKKLHSVGLRVLATICDQGASNVSCIKQLINKTKQKYLRKNEVLRRDIFEVDNEEVIPLYDPPHLIKGIRNNLLLKNLKCTLDGVEKVAKWEHVVKLHDENPSYKGIRMLKNLTEDHVNPEKCKMKVKYATQIFSEKVASTMGYLADKNIIPKECQQTADVLLFFDQLFDSLNGSYENSKRRSGKSLLRAVTPSSDHKSIWANAKKVLSTMKFLKNNKEHSVPTICNWLHTVNNVEYLRDILYNKYNIKSIWMRHFNQDPLENFFGAIRSHGARNVNPTPAGFEIAYASLLMNNLTGTHSPGSNCEQDSCKNMFKSMKGLFKNVEVQNASLDFNLNYIPAEIFEDFNEKITDPRKSAQLQYVAGYLLKKTKANVFHDCIFCKESFYNNINKNDYIRAREFHKDKRHLEYPSDNLLEFFSYIQDVVTWVLKNYNAINNIKKITTAILIKEINTNFINCVDHKEKCINYIFDLSCRFFLYNWCKDINNILKGRQKDAGGDNMQILAKNYHDRRKRKN